MALWTSNNREARELLARILPAGLLRFLDSKDAVPESADEELGEGVPNRDNLKVFTLLLKSSIVLPSCLIQIAQIANDERGKKSGLQQTVQTVERQLKTAHKKLSKHVEVALQHWRSSEHAASRRAGGAGGGGSGGGVGSERPRERPVVLRRRRQRVRAEGNWDLLFYQVMFGIAEVVIRRCNSNGADYASDGRVVSVANWQVWGLGFDPRRSHFLIF